jgi:hypothetical protein
LAGWCYIDGRAVGHHQVKGNRDCPIKIMALELSQLAPSQDLLAYFRKRIGVARNNAYIMITIDAHVVADGNLLDVNCPSE